MENRMTTEHLKRGLTGIVPVRNNIELQYCAEIAVLSMLPICDEVILSDGGSTDGTREFFLDWATREPKIRVADFPWENPKGDLWFLSRWINWTQELARYDMQCQLDADEVFDSMSYPVMKDLVRSRTPAYFQRINLWGDPQTEAPHGTVCGEKVVRIGPQEHPAVCDNLYIDRPEPWVKQNAVENGGLRIWHLGFLRDGARFVEKSKRMQSYLLNTFDRRIEEDFVAGRKWYAHDPFPPDKRPFKHNLALPEIVRSWCQKRGYEA